VIVRRLSTATVSHTPEAVSSAHLLECPSIPVYACMCYVVCGTSTVCGVWPLWHVNVMSVCVYLCCISYVKTHTTRLSLLHLVCVFKCVYLVCLFKCAVAAGRANRRLIALIAGSQAAHRRREREARRLIGGRRLTTLAHHAINSEPLETRQHALIICSIYWATTPFALCPAVPRPQGVLALLTPTPTPYSNTS
jgi:hypothetical protein